MTTPAEEIKPEAPKEETPKEETPKEETPKEEAVKEEAPKEVDPAVVQVVAERLRFFLSDANLRQDTFLRKVMMSEEGEFPHQVTPEILLRFNTIKQHTLDPAVVLQAAKTLDILEVSDTAIGLKENFTMEKMDENIPLSLFVDKIPHDGKYYTFKTDEIRALFDVYGKVALVKLRFTLPSGGGRERRRRTPAGSALVEFETKEDMEKAAEEVLTTRDGESVEPKKKLELNDTTFEVMLLKEFVDSRKALKMKRIEEEEKQGIKRDKPDKDSGPATAKELPVFKFDWKPGCVIRLEGLSTAECDREVLIAALASGLGITEDEVKERKIYVDYSRGQENGALRFPEPSDDIKAICDKLNSGDVKIKDEKVNVARILEGDEESKYWKDFMDFKTKQVQQRAAERTGNKNHRNYNNKRRRRD